MFKLKFTVALTVLSSAFLIGFSYGSPLFSSSYGIHGAGFFPFFSSDPTPKGQYEHWVNLAKLIANAYFLPVGRVLGAGDYVGTYS